uniref:Large ribosomal subunit protein eL20 n=1 Tax=Thermofilum pendens TaxID=2269 RepID=A0A7C1TB54_THEPE
MTAVRTFKVQGVMQLRSGEQRRFTVYVRGLSEKEALEKVYSNLGSRHKLTRRHIRVLSVSAVSDEEIDDEYVRALAQTDRLFVR